MITYIPTKRENPRVMTDMPSAWCDIPTILKDIIDRFNIKQNKALEFGVEWGYSTSAISNYFETVTGVDTFTGDVNSYLKENHYEKTKDLLKDYKNIQLIESDYQDFIKDNNDIYDLIHVDIVHNYDHTYKCGDWCTQHSRVTIFHDTISFAEVYKVCEDLSNKYNLEFYNYPNSNGLGILINNNL